jgi:hypothetical protein
MSEKKRKDVLFVTGPWHQPSVWPWKGQTVCLQILQVRLSFSTTCSHIWYSLIEKLLKRNLKVSLQVSNGAMNKQLEPAAYASTLRMYTWSCTSGSARNITFNPRNPLLGNKPLMKHQLFSQFKSLSILILSFVTFATLLLLTIR